MMVQPTIAKTAQETDMSNPYENQQESSPNSSPKRGPWPDQLGLLTEDLPAGHVSHREFQHEGVNPDADGKILNEEDEDEDGDGEE
jgi:hypothetical protein